ncbi:MAG: hypothetical protein GY757_10540, partial [bacterium]|nr:hypothetical protein [bacterium]
SEYKGKEETGKIKKRSLIVIDLIVTLIPVVVALTYGLSGYIVTGWFGAQYAPSIPGVKIAILFSGFYIVYALLRGILNGIFVFPYVNIICSLALATVALATLLGLNGTLLELSVSFSLGLLTLGGSAIYILLTKLKLKFPFKTLFTYIIIAAALFFTALIADNYISHLTFLNIYVKFFISVLYRIVIILAIYLMFWRKTTWYHELKKRTNTG